MPAKNSVKKYLENGHYHIYNRGVEKRDIFLDDHDYQTFLSLLKTYLSPVEADQTTSPLSTNNRPYRIKRRKEMNLASDIKLLAYCLMPNHFHLLVRQNSPRAISKLMSRVCTGYVTYFNQKYSRSGTLFQGVYKAALVDEEPYLLHLSRYIHLNPLQTKKIGPFATTAGSPANYPYSSYSKYLSNSTVPWLDTGLILSYFQKNTAALPNPYTSYIGFVEDYRLDSTPYVGSLSLESEEA